MAGSDHTLMMRARAVLLFLIVAGAAGAAAAAGAQARPMVPPNDRAYADIDRLAAAGLIDSLLEGARPFSEREVARLLNEARRNVGRNPSSRAWAEGVIARDLARLSRAGNRVVDAVTAEESVLDSPDRGVPDVPAGVIDARIQPLAAYREGRTLVDGSTTAIETRHSALLGSHVALSIEPRLELLASRDPRHAAFDARLQSGAVSVLAGNVIVQAGRASVLFGAAPTGGLLLSTTAPSLDMIQIASDAPFALPWWFRALGPVRGTLFVGGLGATHQIHPHSKLAAYHLSILPHPRLELGLEVIDAMGGAGGDPGSFGDRVLDIFPIFDLLRKNSDFQFSNKMAAIDAHWRVPAWSGFELYSQLAIDDFDARRLKSVLLQDGGYLVGTSLTCLATCGRIGVRAEYHQTGIRFYTHTSYPIADRAMLLGDPLGPRGLGGYLTIDGETTAQSRIGAAAAFEVRSGNSYNAVPGDAHGVGFHFIRTATAPGEKRARLLGTWQWDATNGRTGFRGAAGGERVTNFGFVPGAARTNWLASLSMEVRP